MATVSLNGIKKTFGKIDVIHGIDVEIEDGADPIIVFATLLAIDCMKDESGPNKPPLPLPPLFK